ncbi:MAG TPA: hypothetical protein VI750_06345 [Pyrinomonadaceae bacterium]|nr:hypothetical protein [Pyrinomonadaceae bacterium]
MPRPARWVWWLLGTALLAAVVAAAVHFSEEREFLLLAERAQPSWLLLAFVPRRSSRTDANATGGISGEAP